MTTLPLNFRPLLAEAERLAREYHDRCAEIHRGYAAWDDLPDYEASLSTDEPDYEGVRIIGNPRRIFTEAQARLLADPTRRDSRAWMAEYIGRRFGRSPWAILALLEARPGELMRLCLPPAQVETGLDIRDILVACVLALHEREGR